MLPIINQAMIQVASAAVKVSGNSLEIYIEAILKNHYPIKLYKPLMGSCNYNKTLIRGSYFTCTFKHVKLGKILPILVEAVIAGKVVMSYVLMIRPILELVVIYTIILNSLRTMNAMLRNELICTVMLT